MTQNEYGIGITKWDQQIADWIHYPQCWDTMAYPSLANALWELAGFKMNTICPTCHKPQYTGGGESDDE